MTSSKRSDTPLRLDPRRSLRLLIFISASHAAALAVLLMLDLPSRAQTLTATAILLSFVYSFSIHGLRLTSMAINHLQRNPSGDWWIRTATGATLPAKLRPSSWISSHLMVLNFSIGPVRRMSVVLLPESIGKDNFRRLRVRLLLEKHV